MRLFKPTKCGTALGFAEIAAPAWESAYLRLTGLCKAKPDGCWIWTGAQQKTLDGRSRSASARMFDPVLEKGRDMPAQRAMWLAVSGEPLPLDARIRTTCGNSMCVRPEHLVKVK